MLGVALLIGLLLLLAAGIGGGTYLIGWPSKVVNAYSPGWRATFVVTVLRLAGAVMVGIGLLLLYLVCWTVTGGPGD